MTINSTYDFAIRINRTHIRFADRSTTPALTNPYSFDTLMRIRDYFKNNDSVISVTVPAVMNCDGIGLKTEIALAPVGKDGWIYMEWAADTDDYIKLNNMDFFDSEVSSYNLRDTVS